MYFFWNHSPQTEQTSDSQDSFSLFCKAYMNKSHQGKKLCNVMPSGKCPCSLITFRIFAWGGIKNIILFFVNVNRCILGKDENFLWQRHHIWAFVSPKQNVQISFYLVPMECDYFCLPKEHRDSCRPRQS